MRKESRQERRGEEQEEEKAHAETEEASRNRFNQQTMQKHTEISTIEHHQGIKREQCEQLNEARRSITADLENNSQEGGTVSPLLTAVKLPG